MSLGETMLERIRLIDPSKKCLNFLYDRIKSDNYRGKQISQHNRYTFEQVVGMIRIFYDLVADSKMKIRTTDLSKRPYNLPDELVYAEYTNLVNREFGKSTQDSIRKNLFVDFHRMGIINRYGTDGSLLGPYERKAVKEVSLTKIAMELIDKDMTYLQKYMVFSRCLDNILLGLVTDFFVVLSELDHITLHEYSFFISFARLRINGHYYSLEDMIEFTREFRSMSIHQINAVISIVQEYCTPQNFRGDKKQKRDYHNWTNESTQIFTLLDMTPYYDYNISSNRIDFMIKSGYVFSSNSDIAKLKRSVSEKKEYFNKHSVPKTIGFELHHVVPLLWAKTSTQFFILDKWQNMLYIDGGTHSIITQYGNKHVLLKFPDDNNNIRLFDYNGKMLELKENINTLYDPRNKNQIFKTNHDLLNSFGK